MRVQEACAADCRGALAAEGSPLRLRPAPTVQGYLTYKKTHPPRTLP